MEKTMISRKNRSEFSISKDSISSATIIVFFLPLLTVWKFNFGGDLMISDIAVAILGLALLFRRGSFRARPYFKLVLSMLAIWTSGVVLSDLINGSSISNFMRGFAGCIFFGFYIFVFFVLIDGKKNRMTAAVSGASLSSVLLWATGNSAFSSHYITDTPWKMGVGLSVTMLFSILLMFWIKKPRVVGQVLSFTAPVHLILNARSLFLTTFLAGVATSYGLKIKSKSQRKLTILVFSMSCLIIFPLAESLYGNLTSSGVFGEEARSKFESQTNGGTISILLAGRSEALISFRAIYDSPVFGHGSWAQSDYYYSEYLRQLELLGERVNWENSDTRERKIPSHSMLFGSWVDHGFPGALFWIVILLLSSKVLSHALTNSGSISPVEMLVLFTLIWDIFFSPFGQARRCIEAVYIVCICYALGRVNRNF